ncbi:MAG: flagellin, partial [Methanomicrobiales archaeon]
KSQQVVHAGVTQAASNIVAKGNVYGITADTASGIQLVQFDLGLAAGGLPVDISKIQMVYSTANLAPETYTYVPAMAAVTNKQWNVTKTSGTLPLMQEGQYFTVILKPGTALQPREIFSLEIKPENGAALGIERTAPAGLEKTTILF